MVLFDDRPDDREAKAGAAEPARASLVDGVKTLEDVFEVGRRDPDAAIGDGDPCLFAGLIDLDGDFCRRVGIFCGVIEDVDDGQL